MKEKFEWMNEAESWLDYWTDGVPTYDQVEGELNTIEGVEDCLEYSDCESVQEYAEILWSYMVKAMKDRGYVLDEEV